MNKDAIQYVVVTHRGRYARLTTKEFMELFHNTKVMIDWSIVGTYGDGDQITDKRGILSARKAVDKLKTILG